jgi:hypothetical protein
VQDHYLEGSQQADQVEIIGSGDQWNSGKRVRAFIRRSLQQALGVWVGVRFFN